MRMWVSLRCGGTTSKLSGAAPGNAPSSTHDPCLLAPFDVIMGVDSRISGTCHTGIAPS